MEVDGTDASIEAFLQTTPECCYANRRPRDRNPLDIPTGFNVSEILLNYRQKVPVSPAEPFSENHFSVSSCGVPLKRKCGMNHSALQKIN